MIKRKKRNSGKRERERERERERDERREPSKFYDGNLLNKTSHLNESRNQIVACLPLRASLTFSTALIH